MKFAIRVLVLSSIVAATVVGNSMPRTTTVASLHPTANPGPVPTCNPYTQTCQNLRSK